MFKVFMFICFVGNALAAPSTLDFMPLNNFSLKLLDNTFTYQELFGKTNIAISPVSVWTLFSLIAEGSTGQTFQELIKELRLPNDLRATQALHGAVNELLKKKYEDVTLKGQGALFMDCSLEIHPEFCQAATSYQTEVFSVNTSNLTVLTDDINTILCYATDGRILNAISEENLKNLRLILVDALYFKANWTIPFDPTQTKEEDFYDYQGKSIGKINMMYHKAPHNFADVNEIGAQVLEMTYGKDQQYSMLILLPFDGTQIKQLLSNLASQPFDWINNVRHDEDLSEIDVYIPRIKVTSQSNLIPPLQYSGIQSIFNMEKAELPGISDSPLYITSVTQNVDLKVTEEGTVAAAATVVGLEDRFLGNRFEANRNFVYLITERKSNLIIFAGIYQVPYTV